MPPTTLQWSRQHVLMPDTEVSWMPAKLSSFPTSSDSFSSHLMALVVADRPLTVDVALGSAAAGAVEDSDHAVRSGVRLISERFARQLDWSSRKARVTAANSGESPRS